MKNTLYRFKSVVFATATLVFGLGDLHAHVLEVTLVKTEKGLKLTAWNHHHYKYEGGKALLDVLNHYPNQWVRFEHGWWRLAYYENDGQTLKVFQVQKDGNNHWIDLKAEEIEIEIRRILLDWSTRPPKNLRVAKGIDQKQENEQKTILRRSKNPPVMWRLRQIPRKQ